MMRRRNQRHPLLSPFPVVVAAVATFLVVVALLAAQLQAGRDPGLAGASIASVQSRAGGGPTVTTRTSGGGAAARPSTGASSHGTAVSTHQSGSSGEED